MFCLDESPRKLTKEHLLSVPVCRAFGIERDDPLGRYDGANAAASLTVVPISQTSVKLPCDACNNGWMSQLEIDMAKHVAPWVYGSDRLSRAGLDTLRRWSLKTHLVLSALAGGARKFLEDPTGAVCPPDVSRALLLREGDPKAFEGAVVGVAQTRERLHLYGFGNPTVVPVGPDRLNVRSASVMCLNLAPLQVWTVIPLNPAASVQLPRGVSRPIRGALFQRLPVRPTGEPPLEEVIVNNGDITIDMLDALAPDGTE